MISIETVIGKQKFVISGDDSEEHLAEVTELVRRKVEALRKNDPSITLQRAAMLAAFDFASEYVKSRNRSTHFKNTVVAKAKDLLDRLQSELEVRGAVQ